MCLGFGTVCDDRRYVVRHDLGFQVEVHRARVGGSFRGMRHVLARAVAVVLRIERNKAEEFGRVRGCVHVGPMLVRGKGDCYRGERRIVLLSHFVIRSAVAELVADERLLRVC